MTDSWVILNGQRLPAAEARVSPLSDGFLFGLGLFETIKVLEGRVLFLTRHFDRLRRGAAELGLPLPTALDALRARCDECVAANELRDGALKLVLFQDTRGVSELILTRPATYSPAHYARGFQLTAMSASRRTDRISGLKSLNYLTCILAKRAAQSAGYDEALFVDADGRVLEGSTTNVFVVKHGVALTPPLDHGVLPGIARSHVLRLLGGQNAREEIIPASLVTTADEVFVTNSLLGVMPVAGLDAHPYDLSANPVTKAAMVAYRKFEAQSGSNDA